MQMIPSNYGVYAQATSQVRQPCPDGADYKPWPHYFWACNLAKMVFKECQPTVKLIASLKQIKC